MGYGLLLLVGLIYVGVAVDYAMAGKYGMALVFVSYAAANIGFAWDSLK